MSEQEGLFQTVLADPEDDAPRLVYADWLEDHGDFERAEFIRLQIGRARGRGSNLDREGDLLRQHELAWTSPLHSLVQRARFVRGFVERVHVMADLFLERAEDLFRLAPVCTVVFTHTRGHMDALAASPYLLRLRGLDFRGSDTPNEAEVVTLVSSPNLNHVVDLALRSAEVGDFAWRAIAASPHLARLRSLDLYGCRMESYGEEGLQPVAVAPQLAGLERLVLGAMKWRDWGVDDLVAPGSRLTSLRYLHLAYSGIGNSVGRALAGSPVLEWLERLVLTGCTFDRQVKRDLDKRFGSRIKW